MSLDETCLSNGDVYTILTNKSAHGGKGSLAAMIRGVATDTVSAVLKKIPLRQRLKVRTVTTDLSSAMMLTVRTAFPGASLINDRFHVQQLVSEAVDQLRISHRWEVLEEENKAIREHRARRKAAKTKEERELVGQWEPERMENGETLPQIMARTDISFSNTGQNGMHSRGSEPEYSSESSPTSKRHTTCFSDWWTFSTENRMPPPPDSTLPDGTMKSPTLEPMSSTKSLKPFRITMPL